MRTHLALVLAAALGLPAAATAQTFTASLSPGAVLPAPGQEGASGFAIVSLSGSTGRFSVLSSGLDRVTGVHIREGDVGVTGVVVVDLEAPFTAGTASGRVTTSRAIAERIAAHPEGYYLQVDTASYPSGALRGQLAGGTSNGTTLYFPVVATVRGAAGSQFRTDARFVNRSEEGAALALEYYAEGADGHSSPTATTTATLAPGEQLVLDDLVAALFAVTNGKGALIARCDREVSGLARVYNDQRAAGLGTFGQLVRGATVSQAYPAGVLPFLSNQAAAAGTGFRSNLGWFNPGTTAVSVTFTAHDASGALLGEVTRPVAGLAQEQYNLATLWPSLADYGDLYLTYRVEEDASLFVYASVVDNVNGDAVYVAAAPAE